MTAYESLRLCFSKNPDLISASISISRSSIVTPPRSATPAMRGAASLRVAARAFNLVILILFRGCRQGDPAQLRRQYADPALPGSRGAQHHRAAVQGVGCNGAAHAWELDDPDKAYASLFPRFS